MDWTLNLFRHQGVSDARGREGPHPSPAAGALPAVHLARAVAAPRELEGYSDPRRQGDDLGLSPVSQRPHDLQAALAEPRRPGQERVLEAGEELLAGVLIQPLVFHD